MKELDGNKIKQIRQDKGLTQSAVAKKMKMYDKTYARKEKEGDFNEEQRNILIEILRVRTEDIEKAESISVIEPNGNVSHGNGNNDPVVTSKNETIASKDRYISFLEAEIVRLRSQLETNYSLVKDFAIANNGHLETLLECFAKHRAFVEKKPVEKVREEQNTILSEVILELDKRHR